MQFDTDFLVVGTGPMGATTALALATYGVRVHVVNRVRTSPTSAVEVLRDLGLEQDARRDVTPWEWMGDTLFTTSLAGPEIARLRTWGTGDERIGDYLQAAPARCWTCPRTRWSRCRSSVQRHAARSSRSTPSTWGTSRTPPA